jgi:hypothetical protein
MLMPFSKRWKTARKYNVVMHRAVRIFDAQYKFIKLTGKNIETKRGINKRGLGYLEGYIKSAMKAQQLDMTGEHAFAVIKELFEKIWGKELGERYFEYWTSTMNDDETKNGAESGGLDFSVSSTTGRPPTGWYGCFKNEEEAASIG